MKNKSQLSAFSVMEVIVSMAVAAIVMGLTFVIFSILTERMLDYKKQNQAVSDLNRITYSINKDIFDADQMEWREDYLSFSTYSGEIVKYKIEPYRIVRYKEEFIDTFTITTKNIQIDSVQNQTGKVNYQKIKMAILADSVPMDLKFFKPIYAHELLRKKFKK